MVSILTIIADVVKSIPQTLSELTELINLRYLLQHTNRSTIFELTMLVIALESTLDGFLTC